MSEQLPGRTPGSAGAAADTHAAVASIADQLSIAAGPTVVDTTVATVTACPAVAVQQAAVAPSTAVTSLGLRTERVSATVATGPTVAQQLGRASIAAAARGSTNPHRECGTDSPAGPTLTTGTARSAEEAAGLAGTASTAATPVTADATGTQGGLPAGSGPAARAAGAAVTMQPPADAAGTAQASIATVTAPQDVVRSGAGSAGPTETAMSAVAEHPRVSAGAGRTT